MPSSAIHLVIGANGGIGRPLMQRLSRNSEAIGTSRSAVRLGSGLVHLDLGDSRTWSIRCRPTRAWFLAAVTSQKICREQPDLAYRINVEQTRLLTDRLLMQGMFVVFPSTNLVLPGIAVDERSDTPRQPQSAYAQLKTLVEEHLEGAGRQAAIVRLSKVLTPTTPLICDWIEALRLGRPVRAFNDLVISPISMRYAVEALAVIGESGEGGVWQISGSEELSYAAVAKHIAVALGRDPSLVQAVASTEVGIGLDARPKHARLDASRFQRRFGIEREPLQSFLQGLGL